MSARTDSLVALKCAPTQTAGFGVHVATFTCWPTTKRLVYVSFIKIGLRICRTFALTFLNLSVLH